MSSVNIIDTKARLTSQKFLFFSTIFVNDTEMVFNIRPDTGSTEDQKHKGKLKSVTVQKKKNKLQQNKKNSAVIIVSSLSPSLNIILVPIDTLIPAYSE